MGGLPYTYVKNLDRHREAFLADPGIKEADKQLVERFIAEFGTTKNHAGRTTYKYYSYFKTVLRFLHHPLAQITFEDYLRFRQALQRDDLTKAGSKYAVKYNGEAYSEASKEDFDALLRRVLRWHKQYAKPAPKRTIERILEQSPYKPDKNKMD